VRFATSLFGGRLLADSALRAMVRPHLGADGRPVGGGAVRLGWALAEWHGVREVMHGGGTPQVSGLLYLLPARRFAVASPMNLEGASDAATWRGTSRRSSSGATLRTGEAPVSANAIGRRHGAVGSAR
jgi:hypothetical protein